MFQTRTVTASDLGSVANAYTYSIRTSPPVRNVFWIFVSPSLRSYLLLTPHLTPVDSASLYLYTFFSPPQLGQERIDRPPGRRPRLPASIACLRFPPMPVEPRSFLHQTVTGLPLPVAPPFPYRTCTQVPASHRGSPVRGLLPPSTCLHHPHARPPTFWPRLVDQTSAVTECLASCSSFPLSHVHPHRPPRVPCLILVSSEVLFPFSDILLR